ncbi:hypothetical protein ACFX1Q_032641 [Malus domestica]
MTGWGICRERSNEAEKMVLRASRPASRLTAVVEVLCYHGGHSDELEGGQVLRRKMGREGGMVEDEYRFGIGDFLGLSCSCSRFLASTGNHTQIHNVFSWNFSSTSQAFLWMLSMKSCESNIIVTGRGSSAASTELRGTFLIFTAVVVSLYYSSMRKTTGISDTPVVSSEKTQRPRSEAR